MASSQIAAVEPSYRAYTAKRIEDEGLPRKGMLYGELSWWIPDIKLVKIGNHGIAIRDEIELELTT